jgi:hypothetical protein
MPKFYPREATSTLLLDEFGLTMTLAQVHGKFFPTVTARTLQNKKSLGQLPPQRGEVFDTQDVAEWWEKCAIDP